MHGLYKWKNGDIYEGQWRLPRKPHKAPPKLEGFGQMRYHRGDVYEGQFKNDRLDGTGRYYWANGDLYEGQFKEGRFSGKGTYTYADKRTASPASTVQEMEGEEGMNEDMDQLPTLVESFTGFWEDNKLDGHGTIRFTDGEVQVSTFKNDQEVAVGARWSSGKRETAWKVVAGKPTKMLTLDEAAMIARRVGEAVPEVEYQEVEEIYIDQEEEEEFPPGPAEEEEEVDEEERRRLEREAKKAAIVAKAEEARKAQAAAKAEEERREAERLVKEEKKRENAALVAKAEATAAAAAAAAAEKAARDRAAAEAARKEKAEQKKLEKAAKMEAERRAAEEAAARQAAKEAAEARRIAAEIAAEEAAAEEAEEAKAKAEEEVRLAAEEEARAAAEAEAAERAAEEAAAAAAAAAEAERIAQEYTLILSNIRATNVPDADKHGGSDPFARFTLMELDLSPRPGFPTVEIEQGRTQPIFNESNPVWPHNVQLVLPSGQAYRMMENGGPLIKVAILDKDLTTSDDVLGVAEVRLSGESGSIKDCNLGTVEGTSTALQLNPFNSGGAVDGFTISFDYALTKWVSPAATLTINNIKAFGVPEGGDKGSGADPYLRFKLLECGDLDEAVRTSSQRNVKNPVWSKSTDPNWEPLTLNLPRGSPRPPLLLIRLWDDDLNSEDDALAMTEVRLEPSAPPKSGKSSGKMQLELTGIGRKNKGVKVAFDWERVDDEEEEDDPAAGGLLFF